jgi:hypothetical protein
MSAYGDLSYEPRIGGDVALKEYVQGQVNITARYDDGARTILKNNDGQGRAQIFTGGSSTEAHSMFTWETGFTYLPANAGDAGIVSVPKVITSLSGLGTPEISNALADNDKELAREIAGNLIEPFGAPTVPYNCEEGKPYPSHAWGINGMREKFASEDLHFNCLVRACIPTEEDMNLYNRYKGNFGDNTIDRAPLAHKPHTSSDMAQSFFTNLRVYIQDDSKYRKMMGAKYNRAGKNATTMKAFTEADLVKYFLMTYQMVNMGVHRIAVHADTTLPLYNQAPPAGYNNLMDIDQTRGYLCALAAKMQILPNPHYTSFEGVRNDVDILKKGSQLRRNLMRAAYWDPKDVYYSFGANWDTGVAHGIDGNGNFMGGTPVGDMLNSASYMPMMGIIACHDYIWEDGRWIQGRCVRAAQRGGMGWIY